MINIFKQRKTGNLWGYMIHVIGQMGMALQFITLIASLLTLASVLQMRGITIPTWLVLLLAFSVIGCFGILVFRRGLPSFFSAWNQQWYEHNNPMRRDIEELKKMIENLEEKIEESNTHSLILS